MRKIAVFTAVLVFMGIILAGAASADGQYAKILNSDKPGLAYDISKAPVKGKITIIDFYSEFCGPCVRLAPILEKLDRQREDIVVYKLNINRAGVNGIDWRSPLAVQYKLNSIPAFYIYNAEGKITHSGSGATQKVMEYLKESKLL